jgi:hypothetical protein
MPSLYRGLTATTAEPGQSSTWLTPASDFCLLRLQQFTMSVFTAATKIKKSKGAQADAFETSVAQVSFPFCFNSCPAAAMLGEGNISRYLRAWSIRLVWGFLLKCPI